MSTALEEMKRVINERFPVDDWNIYAAQASDGDNMTSDNMRLVSMLEQEVLPLCQYFACIEVGGMPPGFTDRETGLWRTYQQLVRPNGNFAMRRVNDRSDIFPVFRELFSRERAHA